MMGNKKMVTTAKRRLAVCCFLVDRLLALAALLLDISSKILGVFDCSVTVLPSKS